MKHIIKKIPLNSIIELMLIILNKMAEKKRKYRALEFRVRKLTKNELYQFSYAVANNLDDCALTLGLLQLLRSQPKYMYIFCLRTISFHAMLAALTSSPNLFLFLINKAHSVFFFSLKVRKIFPLKTPYLLSQIFNFANCSENFIFTLHFCARFIGAYLPISFQTATTKFLC